MPVPILTVRFASPMVPAPSRVPPSRVSVAVLPLLLMTSLALGPCQCDHGRKFNNKIGPFWAHRLCAFAPVIGCLAAAPAPHLDRSSRDETGVGVLYLRDTSRRTPRIPNAGYGWRC
jgi:hypothetical protein